MGPVSMAASPSFQFGDASGPNKAGARPIPSLPDRASASNGDLHRIDYASSPRSAVDPSFPPVPAPEGFWEPENPPYEDRSALSDPLSASDTGTGVKSFEVGHGASTLLVKLTNPSRVTLEFTKTSMTMFQNGRRGTRTKTDTHTFVIITTTPSSLGNAPPGSKTISDLKPQRYPSPDEKAQAMYSEEAQEARQSCRSSPAPRFIVLPRQAPPPHPTAQLPVGAISANQGGSRMNLTPTEEVMALDLTVPGPSTGPPRPIFFNRDGTVTRHGSGRKADDNDERQLDVHELLRTKDWAQTPLGPRELWPQSLKTIGENIC